jgi:hypothetical protein
VTVALVTLVTVTVTLVTLVTRDRGSRDPRDRDSDPRDPRDPRDLGSRDPRDSDRDPRDPRDPRDLGSRDPRVWNIFPPFRTCLGIGVRRAEYIHTCVWHLSLSPPLPLSLPSLVSRHRHPTGRPAAFPDGYGLRTRTDANVDKQG